jgi:DNA-nicking Smr family endonuclease
MASNGKGGCMLRETMHAILTHLLEVASFKLADEAAGGRAATW